MLAKSKLLLPILVTCLVGSVSTAQVTIIGGSIGNGDFEDTSLSASTSGVPYSLTPAWENINEDTDPNFRVTQGLAGHPDNAVPGTNVFGAFLFLDRLSGNTTGYSLVDGDTLSLSFDVSRHGGSWVGDEFVQAVLYTTTATVDASYNTTTDVNYSELATFNYTILADPFWQVDVSNANLFTAGPADAGKTVYLAFTLQGGDASSPFPRIDNVELTATPVPEPGTFVILSGIAALGLVMYRRRKA
ncbi:MAG: PEP-CTERM sorting domain-containing protein [Puniceicoccaceae bacterium]